MNITDEVLPEDELQKATVEFQANEPPPISHSKAERNKIKKMAREKLDSIKKDATFDPILKSKLAGLSGAYSLKLYIELTDLGILPPLESCVNTEAVNKESEKAKQKEEEAVRLLAALEVEQPKNKRPILTLKRKPKA